MIQVTIPSDRLALGLVADNGFQNGDRVEPPWIVHPDGTRDRLFTNIGHGAGMRGFACWESRLDDIRAAERLFVRCADRNRAAWARAFEVVDRIRAVGGRAHVKPDNSDQNGGGWWEWRVRDNGALSFEWIDPPSVVLHGALGRELYARREYAYQTTAKHAAMARSWLVEATKRYLQSSGTSAELLRLTISGRDYLWRRERNHWGQSPLEPYRFYGDPDDLYAEVSL